MTRNELIKELAKRYGGEMLYSKYFANPDAEIIFHKKTGFSIGGIRKDTKEAYICDEGELQSTYRIDREKMNAKQIDAIYNLLWDYLKTDPEHKDRKQTGWGTKTLDGLIACIERIANNDNLT